MESWGIKFNFQPALVLAGVSFFIWQPPISRYAVVMQTTVTIDSASGTFTITKGTWTGTFPLSEIPKWIAFYRLQQERFAAHATNYVDDIKALEGLADELSAISAA